MSHYMTALAMQQEGLKPATKIVLYWIADHHNESTGDCFPSITRLAELAEMSRRAVEGHIAILEQLNLIHRTSRVRENGSKASNIYELNLIKQDTQNLRIPPAKSAHTHAQNLRIPNLGNNNNKKTNNKLLVKKGCRWTEDSIIEQEWIDWAIEQGLGEEAARLEADKFSDYWIATTGAKATKLNWFATWRNWVRNAQKKTTPRKVVNIFDDPKYFRRAN
jgi:DNA-binding transcriptional ArsR family regulator